MNGSIRFFTQLTSSLILLTVCSLVMLVLAVITLFQTRRLYSEWLLAPFSRLLLKIWGIKMEIHYEAPLNTTQTVFVMNHTSSIDMFAIVSLGLPNTRFFLSGFLRKLLPLGLIGYIIGIFWTMDQIYTERRVELFKYAYRVLLSTGESVCLSPEGERITNGQIGSFNKGAFHLATALKVPMQPIFIKIPTDINPGKGLHAHPGTVHVYIGKPIDTGDWKEERIVEIKEEIRQYYINWKNILNV